MLPEPQEFESRHFQQSFKLAFGRKLSDRMVFVLWIGYALIQITTLIFWQYLFQNNTSQNTISSEIYQLQTTAAPWLYSSWASALITALTVIDTFSVIVLIYIGIMGTFRHADAPGLTIILIAFIDIFFSNYPYMDVYKNHISTVTLTASHLQVTYATLFYRRSIFVSDLDELESICVEERARWRWHNIITEFRYEDGRLGRVSVGGFRFGNNKEEITKLQEDLLSTFKVLANRTGASYKENRTDSCKTPSQSVSINTRAPGLGESTPDVDSDEPATIPKSFSLGFLSFILLLDMSARIHWAQALGPTEANGSLRNFSIFGEGLLGSFLRTWLLCFLPSLLLVWGLRSLLSPVYIPDNSGLPETEILKIALLIAVVDSAATEGVLQKRHPERRAVATLCTIGYFPHLIIAWLVGWIFIALGPETTTLAAVSRYFMPPELWSDLGQDFLTLGLFLSYAAFFGVYLAEERRETLLTRLKKSRFRGNLLNPLHK